MPDQFNKYIDPVKTRWNSLDRPQQYKLVGVIVAVIVAIALAAFFIFRTTYAPLAPVRGFMEGMHMMEALDEQGIRNRLNSNMSMLYVDSRRIQDSVIAINQAEAAPRHDHFTWEHAFDTGLGTTENERFHRARLAVAGDIETQLIALDGISNAIAILNLANPRPFDRNAPPPSASITLNTSRSFAPHEGRSLANLVSRSVNGLEIEQITILDQHSRTIWDGNMADSDTNPVSSAMEAQNMYRNMVDARLLRQLSLLFDEVETGVNLVFGSTISVEQIEDIFTPSAGFEGGIPAEARTSRAQLESTGGGFEPGTAWNIGTVPGYALGGQGLVSADQRENIISYNVNHQRTVSHHGADWVDTDRSHVSVTARLWSYVYQDHWMRANEEADTMDWNIYVNQNSAITFITEEFVGFDETMRIIESATGLPIENISLTVTHGYIFIPSIHEPWNIPLFVMLAVLVLLLLMLAYGLLQRQKQENEEEEAEPELSVEDLLVSTQLEEAKEEATEELDAIEYFKENEIKKHIEKFVNEKPEAVASLLRNWINIEEW